MAAYSYKVKGLYKAPAQKVGELFEELEHSVGLTPQNLLDASRAKGTLLHDEFCWDNKVAAEKYRLSQAQDIIRCVVKTEETDDEAEEQQQPVRAFVNIPGAKTAYVSINNALTNDMWRKHLLESAKHDMELFIAKYNRLEELASVIDEMKKIQAE